MIKEGAAEAYLAPTVNQISSWLMAVTMSAMAAPKNTSKDRNVCTYSPKSRGEAWRTCTSLGNITRDMPFKTRDIGNTSR